MASSSSSQSQRNSTAWRGGYYNRIVAPMKCYCGSKMYLQISGRKRSFRRKFFSCPHNWRGVGGCSFFVWYEPEDDIGDDRVEALSSQVGNGGLVQAPNNVIVNEMVAVRREIGVSNKLLLTVVVILMGICIMRVIL